MLDQPYAAGVSLFSSDVSVISVIFLSDLKEIMIALKNDFRSVPSLTCFGIIWTELVWNLLKGLVEFTSETIWSGNFLCWEILIAD